MKTSLPIKGVVGFVVVMLVCGLLPFPANATRTVISATLNGASSVTVPPSTSITANVTVTTSGLGTNDDWQSTSWQVGIGGVTCVNHADHTNSGTFSESFTITAPITPAVYNVSFIAYQDDTCSQNQSATFTLTGGITVTPAPTPSPTPTPTPSPSVTPSPSPTPTPTGGVSTCDSTWNVTFQQTSGSAARSGTVGFKVALPGLNYGHVQNNPSISDMYQYPHVPVTDSSMYITSNDADLLNPSYDGTISMGSADAVVLKFDLWCMDTADSYTIVKTFTWTIPSSSPPLTPPSPTGTISDISYVSFFMVVDSDATASSDGLILNSQVQLRNLKTNL